MYEWETKKQWELRLVRLAILYDLMPLCCKYNNARVDEVEVLGMSELA
jgi:hypothetical protein